MFNETPSSNDKVPPRLFFLESEATKMKDDEAPFLSQDTKKENEPNTFGIIDSNSVSETPRMLSLTESYIVMCGIYIGTGILILPHTVMQLGAVTWCAILLFSVVSMFICSHLMNISGQRMLQVNEIVTEIRDPYPAIGEFAIGLVFRRLIITLLYTTSTLLTVGLILLSATALQGLMPIHGPSYDNVIRIWATIITISITPVMYLANYSHLLIPSFIAISMSVLSLFAIIINCFIARYSYDVTPTNRIITSPAIDEVFLIPLGSIVFAVGGLPLAIPNILTLSSNPKKLTLSIFGCSSTLLIMFSIAGLVPYFFLGENILPSISTTFVEIMKVRETGVIFQLLTDVVQLFMVIHMLMACVLSINPIFLHLEEVLDIPYEMGWKRVVVRTSLMVINLIICMIIPIFQTVLSFTGAVPLIFLGVTFPLIIYVRVFDCEMEFNSKMCIYIGVAVSVAFVFSYLVLSLMNILV